ncbi:acetyltransferase [Comamonas serinivorans]|uniref:Acetyltransferase n=1 Tax=Comamonas serinivorans TaxID=1082851 RepID=A0A1Y0EMS6_9BURK|nr:acetyltransferase [Comamonas serinivorans]
MFPSPLRVRIRASVNRLRRQLWRLLFGRLLFGERSQGALRPATRLSPTVLIEHEDRLRLADDVFIGHFVFIEASAGVALSTGVQVTNFVSIVSHSTHRSVRVAKALSGLSLDTAEQATGLPGDRREAVTVGAHSFIGPHSTLEAGTRLGACCLVAAHSRVRGVVPDFAVVAGSPAQVVGDVRTGDAAWLTRLAGEHGLDGAELQAAYQRWVQAVTASSPGAPGLPQVGAWHA